MQANSLGKARERSSKEIQRQREINRDKEIKMEDVQGITFTV